MKQMEVQKNENLESKENIQTQLQEQYLKNLDVLEDGQLIDGVVVQVTPEQVFVDVGYKSEGKIPISEFSVLPNVGDTVSVGQVVCIVEAMKLMNEIESEVSGKVVQICVEDGQSVEYGQVLMYVE